MKPKGMALMIVEKLKKERAGQAAAPAKPSEKAAPDVPTFPTETEGEEEPSGLEACADDVISAVKSGDGKALADALKSFLDVYESEGHSEGEAE